MFKAKPAATGQAAGAEEPQGPGQVTTAARRPTPTSRDARAKRFRSDPPRVARRAWPPRPSGQSPARSVWSALPAAGMLDGWLRRRPADGSALKKRNTHSRTTPRRWTNPSAPTGRMRLPMTRPSLPPRKPENRRPRPNRGSNHPPLPNPRIVRPAASPVRRRRLLDLPVASVLPPMAPLLHTPADAAPLEARIQRLEAELAQLRTAQVHDPRVAVARPGTPAFKRRLPLRPPRQPPAGPLLGRPRQAAGRPRPGRPRRRRRGRGPGVDGPAGRAAHLDALGRAHRTCGPCTGCFSTRVIACRGSARLAPVGRPGADSHFRVLAAALRPATTSAS